MSPHRRRSLLHLPFALITCTAVAQSSPPSDTQLSPQSAYQDALHPLEATRQNIANWSDVEIAAMNVAIANAKAACTARKPTEYAGNTLLDLARLCSLGQQWPVVVDIASRYIAEATEPNAAPHPLLPDAYVAQTEASLRLHDEPAALSSALTMLAAVPYTVDIGDAVDEALGYLRFVHTADALKLASARQTCILAALQAPHPAIAPTPHILYAQGLSLAALQQLTMSAAAPATVAALDAALPNPLSPDESIRIDRLRRQYALLGNPLPALHPLRSLSSPPERLPQLPAAHTITALLLFPDWCAACVRLGPQLPETVFKVEGHSAYLYALLAETVPARKPETTVTNTAFNPAYAAAMLAETPTVTVPSELLTRFPADQYPLLLLTDDRGILRVLQPVGAQDLQPGGDLDAAVAFIGRTYNPLPTPTKPATPPTHPPSPSKPTPTPP